MRKFALLAVLAAALAVPSVAAAATPQGKLTGSATLGGFGELTITTAILDGGTSYVGLENDRSGNCSGDTGAVTYNSAPATISCAHFTASSRDGSGQKMRFAFQEPGFPSCYSVFRVSDGGATDKVGGISLCGNFASYVAQQIVNVGLVSGAGAGSLWTFSTVDGYTVTASQT